MLRLRWRWWKLVQEAAAEMVPAKALETEAVMAADQEAEPEMEMDGNSQVVSWASRGNVTQYRNESGTVVVG